MKSPTPLPPPDTLPRNMAHSPIITDPNLPTPPAAARVKKAAANPGVPLIAPRVDGASLKPASREKISRPGLGRVKPDGRRSGGQFSCKALDILDTAHTDTDVYLATPEADRPKLPGYRALRVPLHLDPGMYPTISDTEAVMDEYEERYETEGARDRVLSAQVDPISGKPLGFGPFDPAARGNSDPNAGKAWLGTHPVAGVA